MSIIERLCYLYREWKHINYLKLHGGVDPCEDTRSDYASLLARHNVLREAVAKYFKSERLEILKRDARAEVDRLLQEASNDGNS